jgi:protocatechuate 3,4-dioxygenase beta subunit
MKNDDEQVGRILSRREMIKLLGVAGVATLVGCGPELATPETAVATAPLMNTAVPSASSTPLPTVNVANPTATLVEAAAVSATAVPTCVVRPALTEGPYFVDERLNRSDIRSDPSDGSVREGAPLYLIFNVSQINADGCTAFPGVFVDVWHCDAQGVYSDAQDRSFDTTGKKFLRGYQETDANGQAQFLTIYPGWYNGRAVHIHFKIRTSLDDNGQEFTSQLFFDEAFTDTVYTQEPYTSTGQRTLLNNQDGIFQQSGGLLTLYTTKTNDGYLATFDIGLDMT